MRAVFEKCAVKSPNEESVVISSYKGIKEFGLFFFLSTFKNQAFIPSIQRTNITFAALFF